MNWLIFWLLIYLCLLLILSWRHVKSDNMEEYLVNNRSTGLFALIATTTATFVGGGTSIALMAMGYEAGFTAVWIGVAQVIGFLIMFFFAGRIRDLGVKEKLYSFPHYLNHVYRGEPGSAFAKWFSRSVSGVNIFIFFFLLAAQFVAMASLLKFSFEIGYTTAAVISAVIVIVYTALAGLSGVIVTDIIQFIAIVIMIVVIFIPGIVHDTDTFARLAELPRSMLVGTHYGWPFLIALPMFFSWTIMVRMDVWQRVLAARSARVAKRTMVWTAVFMLPFYVIFPLAGMAIRLTHGEGLSPKDVGFIFIDAHSLGFIMGFALIGLLSALMSSGDSYLNIIAISAIKDFKKGNTKTGLTKSDYRWIKYLTVVFGFIAMGIALNYPNIVDLLVVGLSTIVIFAPITLFALKYKDAGKYRKVAMASIVSGFFVNLLFFIYGILNPGSFEAKSSFIPAFIIASLVLIVGVQYKKRKNRK